MVEQQNKPDMEDAHDKAKAELLGSDNDNDSDHNSEKIIVEKQDKKGSDKEEEVFQDCLDEV